jgi:hypothetical protein
MPDRMTETEKRMLEAAKRAAEEHGYVWQPPLWARQLDLDVPPPVAPRLPRDDAMAWARARAHAAVDEFFDSDPPTVFEGDSLRITVLVDF